MDPADQHPRPIEADTARLEVEHAPPISGARSHRPGLRRTVDALVLAAGLLAVGGASVVVAASPSPSASTSPSTQAGGTYGGGHAPGSAAGCQHGSHANGGSSGGSTSPGTSPGA